MNAKFHQFFHACMDTLIFLGPLALIIALVALVLLSNPSETILMPVP